MNIALDKSGIQFDWSRVQGDLIKIITSPTEPAGSDVYAKVKYFDNWFYIGRNDVASRETLTMISTVLTLKAGGISTERPLLTLPVAGG